MHHLFPFPGPSELFQGTNATCPAPFLSVFLESSSAQRLPGIGNWSPRLEGAHGLRNSSVTAMLLSLQMEESGPVRNVSIKVGQDESGHRTSVIKNVHVRFQIARFQCLVSFLFFQKPMTLGTNVTKERKKRESRNIEGLP